MADRVEAEVSGTFVHAGDGRVYTDGDTCEVSEETIERHPTVLERADGGNEGNPGEDSSTDGDDDGESPSTWWWIGSDGESFDPDAWLSESYTERVEAVESGDLDHYLDDVKDVETSERVMNAVEERREEQDGSTNE